MTQTRSQLTYQVRLGWGADGLTELATADVVVIVDALDTGSPRAGSDDDGAASVSNAARELAAQAAALPHSPAVFIGTLRNATATATAIYNEQLARGGRVAINLVLVGDDGRFAVEDYLAAGAIADGLSALGIDHSAPDVAVAAEGFRPLRRAVKHLFSASASGLALKAVGRGEEAKTAAALDAEAECSRVA
ncbi:MAG: 2-phosphosulfolactate phosphatase [Ancrocorticia sp.]